MCIVLVFPMEVINNGIPCRFCSKRFLCSEPYPPAFAMAAATSVASVISAICMAPMLYSQCKDLFKHRDPVSDGE